MRPTPLGGFSSERQERQASSPRRSPADIALASWSNDEARNDLSPSALRQISNSSLLTSQAPQSDPSPTQRQTSKSSMLTPRNDLSPSALRQISNSSLLTLQTPQSDPSPTRRQTSNSSLLTPPEIWTPRRRASTTDVQQAFSSSELLSSSLTPRPWVRKVYQPPSPSNVEAVSSELIEIDASHRLSGRVNVVKPVIKMAQTMHPFEIMDSEKGAEATDSCKAAGFAFRRRGGSLSWAMGLNVVLGDWNSEVASLYTKCSDVDATLLMMSTTVGPNAYIMASDLCVAGFFPSVVMLVLVPFAYLFLLLRIIDVPQLVGDNIETCHDMVKRFFQPLFYRVSCFFIVLSAAIRCGGLFYGIEHFGIELLHTQLPDEQGKQSDERERRKLILRIASVVFLAYTSSLWCSNRSIRLNAKVGISALVLAFALMLTCLVWKVVALQHPVHRPMIGEWRTWVPALRKASYAFGGISFVPHVVGDMQKPENAGKMLKQTVFTMMMYYFLVFIVSFLCHGAPSTGRGLGHKQLLTAIDKNQIARFDVVRVMCYVIRICFVLQCFTSYVIILWPMSREIHRIIGMDRAPENLLGLPWAIKRSQRAKLGIRFLLTLASSGLYVHAYGWAKKQLPKELLAGLSAIPRALVDFLILPLCVCVALFTARRRMDVAKIQAESESFNSPLSKSTDSPTATESVAATESPTATSQEFFGQRIHHFAITLFMLTCSGIVGLIGLLGGVVFL